MESSDVRCDVQECSTCPLGGHPRMTWCHRRKLVHLRPPQNTSCRLNFGFVSFLGNLPLVVEYELNMTQVRRLKGRKATFRVQGLSCCFLFFLFSFFTRVACCTISCNISGKNLRTPRSGFFSFFSHFFMFFSIFLFVFDYIKFPLLIY